MTNTAPVPADHPDGPNSRRAQLAAAEGDEVDLARALDLALVPDAVTVAASILDRRRVAHTRALAARGAIVDARLARG